MSDPFDISREKLVKALYNRKRPFSMGKKGAVISKPTKAWIKARERALREGPFFW